MLFVGVEEFPDHLCDPYSFGFMARVVLALARQIWCWINIMKGNETSRFDIGEPLHQQVLDMIALVYAVDMKQINAGSEYGSLSQNGINRLIALLDKCPSV